MSEPLTNVDHKNLIKGYARVNNENELGQLRNKACIVALLEGKLLTDTTIQKILDELTNEAKNVRSDLQDYPEL